MAESNAVLNFFRSKSASYKDDLLSGITVALALVPEAVAFAFVAGVSPLIGLYSAFFIGLITAVAGGRPGMISGATGAMAVVVVALVATQGIEYLFPTVVLCGLIQLVIGAARLGRLIRMVPHSVMLGFVNGLAIVIGMAQLGSFKHLNWQSGQLQYLTGTPLAIMLGLVGLTMATIWLLPKLTRAVPASLVAIVGVTILSFAINYSMPGAANPDGTPNNMVATVGDMLLDKSTAIEVEEQQIASGAWQRDDHGHIIVTDPEAPLVVEIPAVVKEVQASGTADISGSLPIPFFMQYALPPLEWQTLWIILPFSLTLAGVGLIESLMTLSLVDEITETRGDGNRECLGQGTANVICGLFGGMGGCAMIGQSLINVNSGGRGRLSGITAAVCLLLFILFLSPWIVQIPIAALVGVMFMVVIGTFEWASLKMFRRVPHSDMLVMLLVTGYTVFMHDLATAVILGVIVSALVFAWRHSMNLDSDTMIDEEGRKVYQLHGPLYFASVTRFKELFSPNEDPQTVIVDFYYTRVYDQSGLEAIHALTEKYAAAGKTLKLRHISQQCQQLLQAAGDLVTVSVSDEPAFHVETDRLGRTRNLDEPEQENTAELRP